MKIQRKTDWILREALLEDKEKLISFFAKNLWKDKESAADLYQWKHEMNPSGRTLALIGTNQDQEIIATSMFMPSNLSVHNQMVKACQWVDLFVELEYRGQPLPSQSLKQGLEEFGKAGSTICFAFPNDNGVAVHKKNSGIHLGLILRYTKPINVKYIVNRRIKNNISSRVISVLLNFALKLISKETYLLNFTGFTIEKAEKCGSEFDDLWNRFSKMGNNMIITCKNSAYLTWKYLNCPDKSRQIYALKYKGRLDGFVVLESTPEVGYIVDILANSQSVLDNLISFSLKHFRKERKNSVVYIALENNSYLPHFRNFGFVERPEINHFYIYLDENIPNREYFLDSKNWFITIGDCDIETLSG